MLIIFLQVAKRLAFKIPLLLWSATGFFSFGFKELNLDVLYVLEAVMNQMELM